MGFQPIGRLGFLLRAPDSIGVGQLTGGVIDAQTIIIAGGTQGIIRSQNYNTTTAGWSLFGDGSAKFLDGIFVDAGSVSAPSLSFITSTGTGMYLRSSNQLGFAIGGEDAFYLNTITDGVRMTVQPASGTWIEWTRVGTLDTLTINSNNVVDLMVQESSMLNIVLLRSVFKNILNLGGNNILTIDDSGGGGLGAITITQSYHQVDTQSAASSDDLDTINGGAEGDILILRTQSSARDVTLKDGTGNLELAGANDFTLAHVRSTIMLIRIETQWAELSRSAN